MGKVHVCGHWAGCILLQVEKTLEMKKWSRNGDVIKQGRNVYDFLAM